MNFDLDKFPQAIFVLGATLIELLWFMCHYTDYEGFDRNVIYLLIGYNVIIVLFYFLF